MKTKLNQSKLKLAIVSAMLLGTAGITAPAYALDANLSVSASIGTACTITTTALAFNAYDAVGANASTDLDAEGVVTSTCSIGSSGNIKMGQGLHGDVDSSDATPLRRMVHGSDGTKFLSYSVFSDSARSVVWENATGVPYVGTGSAAALTVYGSVPQAQTEAIVGSYTDTLVVAINY
jgi:spore coat protein U-like protein